MPVAPDIYKRIVTAKLHIDGNFREPIDLDRLGHPYSDSSILKVKFFCVT